MEDSRFELVYVSAATDAFNVADLPAILEASRKNNPPLGVTGVLLHSDGSFIQVLEGPKAAVEETFERISGDSRHTHVVVLKRGPIEERRFGDWSMGYSELKAKKHKELEGFTDFLRTGQVKSTGEAAQNVLALLERFRGGRFRQAG